MNPGAWLHPVTAAVGRPSEALQEPPPVPPPPVPPPPVVGNELIGWMAHVYTKKNENLYFE